MRAALYIRVSSQGQVRDGYSLEFQEQILREFCEREGHSITEVYRDGGASGATTQRKDLIRLMEDAKQLKFDLVLIFRVDRFSRDPVDLLALVRTLEQCRIRLRSVTEAVDASDPAGELMLTILGAIGKFVRANIIQNAMLGKNRRAKTGKFTGGKIPFGYIVGEDGRYLPDHSEWVSGLTKAGLVRHAFALYEESFAAGKPGIDYVVQWFTAQGIPSPDGIGWTKSTIHQWYRNPVYAGSFAYAKRSQPMGKTPVSNPQEEWILVPDAHVAIVPRELFDRVQALMEQNRSGGRHAQPEQAGGLLTGFACCSSCGASLSLRRPNRGLHGYYVCGSRVNDSRRRRGTACLNFPFIRADMLEDCVWAHLERVALDPSIIADIMQSLRDGAGPQLETLHDGLSDLKRRLTRVEDEEMTITTAYAKGKLPQHLWERQIARLEEDRNRIKPQIRRTEEEINTLLRHPALAIAPEQIANTLRTLFRPGMMSHEEKRQALGLLLKGKGVSVSPDGSVKITLQFPFQEAHCSPAMANLSVESRHSMQFDQSTVRLAVVLGAQVPGGTKKPEHLGSGCR